jgi:hypothetical protein
MLDRLKDRERNTFEYSGVPIFVEADPESISGISFSIPDKDLNLPNTFCSFAYFDDLKRFIDCGQDWNLYLGKG